MNVRSTLARTLCVLVPFPAAAATVAPEPAPTPPAITYAPSAALGSGSTRGLISVRDVGDEESAFIAGLAEKGMHELVVREAQKFLKARPTHRRAPTVRYRLGSALFDLGRFEEARPEFDTLAKVANFEQSDEVQFRLGQCELRRDGFAAAERCFGAVVAGKTDYLQVPARFLLGEARFRSGKFPEAAEAYSAVLKAPNADTYAPDARHGLVWCAWRQGQGDATIQLAEDFLRRHAADPRSGEVAFLAGEAHLDAGRPSEAERAYARVQDGSYRDAALRGLGFAAAARGDHAGAAARFGDLLQEFPTSRFAPESALQRGVHLVRAGEMLVGLEVLEKPPAIDDATNRYWRSRALALVGDHAGALREANAALGKKPDDTLAVQLRIAAGDALFELGREKEAAEMYERSGSAYALHAAAVAKLNAGEADEADRLARTLLDGAAKEKGAPYRAEALLVRGEAQFRRQRYAEAEPFLRAAAAEGDAALAERARARLAWCDWYAGEHAAAARGFAQVAERGAPESAEEAAYMSARAWLESGDTSSARSAFQRYLQRFPAGTNAADALLRLANLLPEAEARALLAELAESHQGSPEAERALLTIAEQKSAVGDHSGAVQAWRTLLQRFPSGANVPQARYGLGWSLHQGGDAANAAEPLWAVARDQAATADQRAAALELLVWVERDAGHAAESRAAWQAFAGPNAAMSDEARCVRAARVAANALTTAGDRAALIAHWTEVLTRLKSPAERGPALVDLGFALLDTGDVAGAKKRADEARVVFGASTARPTSAGGPAGAKGPAGANDPAGASRPIADADPAALVQLAELDYFIGEALYEQNDDAGATGSFVAAARHGADEVAERALYKAGFAELRAEHPILAAQHFAALAERFPKGMFAGEAQFLVGETSYRAGDLDAATLWLKRHLADAPKHAARPKALFRLGLVQGEREDWVGSATTLAELASKFPDFPGLVEAELWRGRALARQDQRRAARQALEGVTTRNKGALGAAARVELGRIAEDEGDFEGAVSEYLKVAVLYADSDSVAEALFRAGTVLERQGDRERADAQYNEVLARFPKNAWATQAKARLARKERDTTPQSSPR